MITKFKAFTLAEVLIPLGIIGVVAALTLSLLTQNYKKHVVETKLAKFYTNINQAVRMSSVENGEPIDWVKDCGTSGTPKCTTDEAIEWFTNYLGKYISVSKISKRADDKAFFVYFNDGSVVLITKYLYDIIFYISEKSLENERPGINKFTFRFMPELRSASNVESNKYTVKSTIEPFLYNWDGTIKQLYTGTKYSCDGTIANYCAKIIQINGWKIPKDYPLRF